MVLPLGKTLSGAINKILKKGPIDKGLILELKNEIFKALLDADIQFDIAYKMTEIVHERALIENPPPGISKRCNDNIVYEELARIMGWEAEILNLDKKKNVIMVIEFKDQVKQLLLVN